MICWLVMKAAWLVACYRPQPRLTPCAGMSDRPRLVQNYYVLGVSPFTSAGQERAREFRLLKVNRTRVRHADVRITDPGPPVVTVGYHPTL